MRRLVLVLASFLLAFAVSAGPLDTLKLGSPSKVPTGAFTSGDLSIRFQDATAADVLSGEKKIGVFIRGDIAFTYAVKDATELPVAKSNLGYLKSRATLEGSNLSGRARSAVILTGTAAPAFEGAAATDSLAPSWEQHRSVFDENRSRSTDSLLTLQSLVPSSTARVIELHGDEDWLHVFDGVNEQEETLARLYTIEFEDRARRTERYEAIIASHPLGRTRLDPPVDPFILTNLDYNLTADGGLMMLTARETFVPKVAGARGMLLNLDDLKYDSRGHAHTVEVKTVKSATGAALSFEQERGNLVVTLPEPSSLGRAITLEFELEGNVLLRPNGDNYWILRGNWYPQPRFSAVAHTVHGTVKAGDGFIPFAGGTTVARTKDGESNVVESRIDVPVAYTAVIAGKYHFEEETRNGLTIRTASYGIPNPRATKRITSLAFDMANYYQYFLGPFPTPELTILEINDFGWGQSPAGMIFITSEAFQPVMGELNRIYSEGVNERIAHEIAHQYWGNNVRWSGWDEAWISEAFAEYSAGLLLRKFQGEAVYKRMVATWKGQAQLAGKVAPIPYSHRITNPNDIEAYLLRYQLLYFKGAYLLAALHKDAGDEQFLTFLKSYQKSFKGKTGTTKDVAGLLGFITKKDYKPFFDRYYWGTELPELK